MAGTILSLGLVGLFLVVVPVIVGSCALPKSESGNNAPTMWYIKGMTIMMAVFQLYAVPLILMKQRFSLVVVLWLVTIGGIVVFAIRKMNLKNMYMTLKLKICPLFDFLLKEKSWITVVLIALAGMLIFIQMYAFVGYQQLDEDDSRFLVHALEAIENDTMLLRNPATGEAVDSFVGELRKDVPSPWPIYLGLLSRIVFMHPAILAHMVLPVFLIAMVYAVYWELAGRFWGQCFEKKCMFLIIASALSMFGGVTRKTEFAYMLSRLWQGKAVVAGVFLPLLLLWILIINDEPKRKDNYVHLFLTNMAMSMSSGMGIAMGAFFVGCVGVALSLLRKDWKMLILLALTCVPNVVFAIINALL